MADEIQIEIECEAVEILPKQTFQDFINNKEKASDYFFNAEECSLMKVSLDLKSSDRSNYNQEAGDDLYPEVKYKGKFPCPTIRPITINENEEIDSEDKSNKNNLAYISSDSNSNSNSEMKEEVISEESLTSEAFLQSLANEFGERKSRRLCSKTTFCKKKHDAQILKKISKILKKDEMTEEDQEMLDKFPHLVFEVNKRRDRKSLASERLKEIEDSEEVLDMKCVQLAEAIQNSNYLIVYTGAGISTAAQIPDYRGPNGIWTQLRQGQSLDSQGPASLTLADPTLTHMAIKELNSIGVIKHIVSQNCDGLHLRSGVPKVRLSEVHGNMYVEVCPNNKCGREYVRNFDVTENTRRYEHRTGRRCYNCGAELKDTVVHFGERGKLRWPLNWAGAEYNVNKADSILCLGTSLKVLRRYPWLWSMDKPVKIRPKLFIVNLQWTPKDQYAELKIHGKCDDVMKRVLDRLNITIPPYERASDPIFSFCTPLHQSEIQSKSSRELIVPENVLPPTNPLEFPMNLNNYVKFNPDFKVLEIEEVTQKKRKKTFKGNGSGWFGNAWGKQPKKKKNKNTSNN